MSQGLPFAPTEEQRRTVRVMAGFGIPQPAIATLLDIDPKTLRLHFRRELDRGAVEATAKVAQTLFGMATSGTNTAASIFWMKARAGWREKQVVEIEDRRSVTALSDEELEAIIRERLDPPTPGQAEERWLLQAQDYQGREQQE